jgi:uncharacterized membrane protein
VSVVTTISHWRLLAALLALTLVPLLAGVARLLQIACATEISATEAMAAARFLHAPIPVTLHILAASLFAVGGAWQLWRVVCRSPFRRELMAADDRQGNPGVVNGREPGHRQLGCWLWLAGIFTALSGIWMTLFYPLHGYDGYFLQLARLLVGTFMLLALLMAIIRMAQGLFLSHGGWMLRAWALAMGAGTQVLTHIPWMLLPSIRGENTRAVLMISGWLINWLVAECVIHRYMGRRGSSHWQSEGINQQYPSGR